MKNSVSKAWLASIGLFAGLALATATTYGVAERLAISGLRDAMATRQDLYLANLESELRRCEYLPQVVGVDPRINAMLDKPDDLRLRQVVNEQLQKVSELTGGVAIYVMNLQGLTLAASNWKQPGSFVDTEFSYRPYFQDAVRGLPGRFYGIGTVSREPGYYFADAVRSQGRIVGVAAVKVSLDKIGQNWAHSGEQVVLADGNGVVFLSSEPQWKFKTLRSLSRETIGKLAATRQYWRTGSLDPLGLTGQRVIDEHALIVKVASDSLAGLTLKGSRYMVYDSPVRGTDWHLLAMADMAPTQLSAWLDALLAAVSLVLIGTLSLYVRQHYRSVAQTQASRAALQRANDELEHKVRVRTEALSQANEHLQNEIAERHRAEQTLKATLRDLVHTAKMAVLGKMSASITHELNQPLTVLQTLSENTITLLDRSMHDDAKSNLRMIAHTAARMGEITGQLKKFARRADVELDPVQVNAVISDALFLLKQGVRGRDIRLETHLPQAGVWALCNANRLEQVIVNLVSNAVDAVEHVAQPAIEVRLYQDEGSVCIEVHDNGPGLDDAVARHLFEPFFTTKEQGAGLGLGLAISNDIVRRFGGVLRAERSTLLGGALFLVQLQLAQPHDASS